MAAQNKKPNLDPQPRVNEMPHLQAPQIDINQRFDTQQTAALCCVSPVSLVNARSLGKSPIPYEKSGRLIRYKYGDILAYLDSLPKFTQ